MTSRNPILSLTAYMAKILPMSYKRALYRYPSISNLIREGLNIAAPEGFTETPIAGGYLSGTYMLLDLHREKDYWLGTYEPELQETIEDLVLPGQIIYDIGANIGFMSLFFAKRAGSNGHVFAFEALPENVVRLERNIELNEMRGRITMVQAAVQDQSGLVDFYLGPSDGMGKVEGSAGRSASEYKTSIRVEGVAIDEFIFTSGNPIPDIVKMDIEGGEILALPGMERLLRLNHPILLVELHGPDAAKLTWELLTKQNYRICRMSNGYPQVHAYQDLEWKSYLAAFPND